MDTIEAVEAAVLAVEPSVVVDATDPHERPHYDADVAVPLRSLDPDLLKRLPAALDLTVVDTGGDDDRAWRLAHRLRTLGYRRVAVLESEPPVGLPASLPVVDVARVPFTASVGEARALTDREGFAAVVDPDGVLVAKVTNLAIEEVADEDGLDGHLIEGPLTVRPWANRDETARLLAQAGSAAVLVTDGRGRLLGQVRAVDLPAPPAAPGP